MYVPEDMGGAFTGPVKGLVKRLWAARRLHRGQGLEFWVLLYFCVTVVVLNSPFSDASRG